MSDDSLFPEKKKSCFWSHDWSDWETIEEGTVHSALTNARTGRYLIQKRTCRRCNKAQLNNQESR